MSAIFDITRRDPTVSYEEKAAWVQGIVAALGYGVYVAVILSRVGTGALVDVPYVDAMLWTIGLAIVVGIIGGIFIAIGSRGRTQSLWIGSVRVWVVRGQLGSE